LEFQKTQSRNIGSFPFLQEPIRKLETISNIRHVLNKNKKKKMLFAGVVCGSVKIFNIKKETEEGGEKKKQDVTPTLSKTLTMS
jgi:hypothetical protein